MPDGNRVELSKLSLHNSPQPCSVPVMFLQTIICEWSFIEPNFSVTIYDTWISTDTTNFTSTVILRSPNRDLDQQEHAEAKASAEELDPYRKLFEKHRGELRAIFDTLGEDPGWEG